MVMYGLKPQSAPQVSMVVPLGVQEMALAIWLVVKGFDTASVVPELHGQPVATL
jgi:hypothetical protein